MNNLDYWEQAEACLDKSLAQEKSNTIRCLAGGEELLRCSPAGFWVRGKKVAQDDNEAQVVYNAFKAWMTWAQLNKDYQ